jgi:hypothetical protein
MYLTRATGFWVRWPRSADGLLQSIPPRWSANESRGQLWPRSLESVDRRCSRLSDPVTPADSVAVQYVELPGRIGPRRNLALDLNRNQAHAELTQCQGVDRSFF